MKTFSRIVVTLACALALFTTSGCGVVVEEVLKQTADKINSQLPMELDAETQLIKVSVEDGLVLKYEAVFVNIAQADVDPAQLTALEPGLKQDVVNMTKTDEEVKQLRDLEVSFRYVFWDNGAEARGFDTPLIDIMVTPEDYK